MALIAFTIHDSVVTGIGVGSIGTTGGTGSDTTGGSITGGKITGGVGTGGVTGGATGIVPPCPHSVACENLVRDSTSRRVKSQSPGQRVATNSLWG